VKPDLSALRSYAKAVYAASGEYLATLSEPMLDTEIDLSNAGLGKRTVGWMLGALVIGHLHNMSGEISTLKGIQGARGYPF
jgi:hypothetical protein